MQGETEKIVEIEGELKRREGVYTRATMELRMGFRAWWKSSRVEFEEEKGARKRRSGGFSRASTGTPSWGDCKMRRRGQRNGRASE